MSDAIIGDQTDDLPLTISRINVKSLSVPNLYSVWRSADDVIPIIQTLKIPSISGSSAPIELEIHHFHVEFDAESESGLRFPIRCFVLALQ